MSKKHARSAAARGPNPRPAREYEVGYCRPPTKTQFQPGQSGNPKGRPKGAQNEATILQEILDERIEVQQNGRPRKISTLKALLLRCRNAALAGDLKALTLLLNRYGLVDGNTPDAQTPLDEDDRKVLEAFAEKQKADLKKGKE